MLFSSFGEWMFSRAFLSSSLKGYGCFLKLLLVRFNAFLDFFEGLVGVIVEVDRYAAIQVEEVAVLGALEGLFKEGRILEFDLVSCCSWTRSSTAS